MDTIIVVIMIMGFGKAPKDWRRAVVYKKGCRLMGWLEMVW